MVKKSKRGGNIILGILTFIALIGVIVFGIGGRLEFTALPSEKDTVYLSVPEFGNVICTEKGIQYNELIEVPDTTEKDYICGDLDNNGVGDGKSDHYLPFGCETFISRTGTTAIGITSDLDKIDLDGEKTDLTGLLGINSFNLGGSEKRLTELKQGEKIRINIDAIFYNKGDVKLRFKGRPYGLEATESGYLKLTNDCKKSTLIKDSLLHAKDTESLNAPDVLPIDKPYNYILFSKPVIADQVFNLIDLDGDGFKELYCFDTIDEGGLCYNVKKTADGFLYADTSESKIVSSIECLPSRNALIPCTSKGKISSTPTDMCLGGIGRLEGYREILGVTEPDEACLSKCVDGKIQKTGSCKKIPECETGTIDWSSLDCVQTTRNINERTPCVEGTLVTEKIETCVDNLIPALCNLGITDPKEGTRTYCKEKNFLGEWGLLTLFGFLLLVFLALLIIPPLRRGKRR